MTATPLTDSHDRGWLPRHPARLVIRRAMGVVAATAMAATLLSCSTGPHGPGTGSQAGPAVSANSDGFGSDAIDHSTHQHDFSVYSNEPTGPPTTDDDGRWKIPVGVDAIELSMFPPDAEPTEEQQRAADDFVATVRRLSSRYLDSAVAEADGYRPDPAFPGGDHWVNVDRLNDNDVLNPEKPEFVMYDPSTGAFLGVMFVSPWERPGPQVGGPLSRWHRHDTGELCWKGQMPLTDVDSSPDDCPDGYRKRKGTPEMLHVWYVDTPDGPYATYMTAGS